MSTVAVVVIVIVVLVVLGVVGFFARTQARRRGLQQRFGPEYDRAVASHENTREAEQELLARQKRHDELEIHPLDPAVREQHLAEWRQVQERFVDAPEAAVTEADNLLIRVMGERGYPTEGFEQQVADLSVEHATTIDRYRQAHEISTQAEAKKASTENLRQAMVHYRSLFTELLDTGDEDAEAAGDTGRATAAETATERETDAEPVAARTDTVDRTTRTDEPVEPVVAEPVADEPVAAEPAERSAADADAEVRAEEATERTEAKTGTRTRTGRRTARRDSEGEGA
jgi:hypothetical protein